jgi:hypothetical protein
MSDCIKTDCCAAELKSCRAECGMGTLPMSFSAAQDTGKLPVPHLLTSASPHPACA